MISISKSKVAPTELRALQGNPHADYSDISEEQNSPIREQLCRDQGFLCAYCCSRISTLAADSRQSLEGADGTRTEHPRRLQGCSIEHISPQSVDADTTLLWTNRVAVCSGRRVWSDGLHCDKSRGDKALHHLNPLSPHVRSYVAWSAPNAQSTAQTMSIVATPHSEQSASARARVQSDIDTLNLNISWLCKNRYEVARALAAEVQRSFGRKPVTKAWLSSRRERLTTPDNKGQLPEHLGVLLSRLEQWDKKAR